jgi:hypothetical protein
MGLSRSYLNSGRTLVTDNYYTSLPLAYELLKNNTHLIGTLRSNRVELPEVMKAKLKKGQITGKENNDGIVVAKWHDKRDVFMMSTKHIIDLVDPQFLETICWTEETKFHNNSNINSQNMRYWSNGNPHWHTEKNFQERYCSPLTFAIKYSMKTRQLFFNNKVYIRCVSIKHCNLYFKSWHQAKFGSFLNVQSAIIQLSV